MSFQRVRKLLEQMAQHCADQGIAWSQETLNECVMEYDCLLTATGSHGQALSIFESLLAMSLQKTNSCGWLLSELHFEVGVARTGKRRQKALLDLRQQAEVDDEALDRYNGRISRFSTQTHLVGHD